MNTIGRDQNGVKGGILHPRCILHVMHWILYARTQNSYEHASIVVVDIHTVYHCYILLQKLIASVPSRAAHVHTEIDTRCNLLGRKPTTNQVPVETRVLGHDLVASNSDTTESPVRRAALARVLAVFASAQVCGANNVCIYNTHDNSFVCCVVDVFSIAEYCSNTTIVTSCYRQALLAVGH